MYYILHNDELGYTDYCPVFESRELAEREAAFKARRHSVIEIEDWQATSKPCCPKAFTPSRCGTCARCSSPIAQRIEALRKACK